MMTDIHSPLRQKVIDTYTARFGSAPRVLVHAPGRINLIGEHTDYNDGFVLPGAIPQGLFFAMGLIDGSQHDWYALDMDETYRGQVDSNVNGGQQWCDYFNGANLLLSGEAGLKAIRCVFSSDLPSGAGLSSSSALTCGFLSGLNVLLGTQKSAEDLAWLGHLVEREYIGLQGGIMDQHACMLCKPDHLLLLDCLDRSFTQIPFNEHSGAHLFLINSCVQHKLIDSDYNTRADECRKAFAILHDVLGIKTLRDLTSAQLQSATSLLGPVLAKRMDFVLQENARVQTAVEAIRNADWKRLGELLYQSHAGLRDDYEVSCPELDFLADMVRSLDDILGARMMGGGFGGCTINLATHVPADQWKEEVVSAYSSRFGHACTFIDVVLSGGTSVEQLTV